MFSFEQVPSKSEASSLTLDGSDVEDASTSVCSSAYSSCLSELSCEVTGPPSLIHTPSPKPSSSLPQPTALLSTPVKGPVPSAAPSPSQACLQLGQLLLQKIRSSQNHGLLTLTSPPANPPPKQIVSKPPLPTSALDVKNVLPSFVSALKVCLPFSYSMRFCFLCCCLDWCDAYLGVRQLHDCVWATSVFILISMSVEITNLEIVSTRLST